VIFNLLRCRTDEEVQITGETRSSEMGEGVSPDEQIVNLCVVERREQFAEVPW